MKKFYYRKMCQIAIGCLALCGCSNGYQRGEKAALESEMEKAPTMERNVAESDAADAARAGNTVVEWSSEDGDITEGMRETFPADSVPEPEVIEAEWSDYFDGCNGCAVLYDTSNRTYTIFNPDLALTRRSPCSTFKIISSLVALEQGIIGQENSLRRWSGETYWNEQWNRDIEFEQAFSASCVWYFREVIAEIGPETMGEELNKLSYGNCDISDWEGRLNTNNTNRALTGFWLKSSLLISPKEQMEVMERIFGADSLYSEETRERLKQVMLVAGPGEEEIRIYGKTGMGKDKGVTVDAWFTGFAEIGEEPLYFCVYLGRTDGKDVSSSVARDIAVHLISEGR